MAKKRRKTPAATAQTAAAATQDPAAQAVRFYGTVLVVLAALAVTLQVLSLQPLKATFWGFHFYAFIPIPIAILNWAVLIVSAIVLLGRTELDEAFGGAGNLVGRRPLVATLVVAVACTAAFFLFRSQQTFLGDAYPLTVGLPGGEHFHPRQPLTMWIQQQIYQALGGLFRGQDIGDENVAFGTTAVGSVALGFVFVFIAVALGHLITRGHTKSRLAPGLVALLLVGQGYALLFFGYVENYTFYMVFIGLYLLTALLYLQGRITLQVPVVVFFVSMALHLSTMGLLPSLLFLVAWGLVKPERRADAALGLVAAFACAFLLNWIFSRMSPGFTLWKGIYDITDIARSSQGGGHGISYMFSPKHFRDFFNEHFLIGPVAAFFLLPALLYTVFARRAWNATAIFLTVAATSYLAGSWMMSEPLLGYARDWDLFAPAAVCYTAAGAYFVVMQTGESPRVANLLAFAVVFSFVQLAPFVRITHSEMLSLERFKYLPLGYGRTEVVVGNWYMRHGDDTQAETWLKRALEVHPYNANAYGFLGTMYSRQGKKDLAVVAFQNAVKLRPDKPAFHNNLARDLIDAGRHREALVELDWLIKREPNRVGYWRALKQCFVALKDQDGIERVDRRLLVFVQDALDKDPRHINALLEQGILLSELGEDEAAYQSFARAMQIEPDAEAVLFNTAMVLTRLGRTEEARPLLQRFLALYPDHERADWARSQLSR